MKNYYAVLGIPEDAESHQIKKAYRELARQFHPDSNSSDQPDDERFIEATEAYRSLIDPFSRAKHDHALRQTWRVAAKGTAQPTYISTDNIRPFMWILAVVLSFAAFMLCVFTALLIEYSPQKSTARNTNDTQRIQRGVATSEASDRATLNRLLASAEHNELSCRVDLVNIQTDCDNIPLFTFFEALSATPRFRITLNPAVASIESVQFEIQYADNQAEGDAWLLHLRDLRPNASGNYVEIRVRPTSLAAYRIFSNNADLVITESTAPPSSISLSDGQLMWLNDGDLKMTTSPLLYQFPATSTEETIDLWIAINRPLDDEQFDHDVVGNIETITVNIVVNALRDE